jgi:hypothetical protein
MSIIDETRSYLASQTDKLQQERARLIEERGKIDAQISEVDDLLVQLGGQAKPAAVRSGGRRSGIRERVLEAIKASPDSISPSQIRSSIGITGKAGSQSVSNAISALKKAGTITATENGGYRAA